ncbi:unnamed protein product [Schistocephalus solidus]|uniref:Coiled-coil domain-containing protein 176 n=1 Tax=Schistocephalus solidus TaxID=70667 RepID=A0A183SHE3_SCHSO|nr:unnamed protein product [Schistocephalus solidus]
MPPKQKGSAKGTSKKKSKGLVDDSVSKELAQVKRQANELQVQINYDRVKTVEAQMNCENALAREASLAQKFESSNEEAKQVSAFMALQQEKTTQKFIEKNKELSALNAKLTEERDRLKEELETTRLTAKTALEAKESEVRQIRDAMTESHLRYEGLLTDFALKLSEGLVNDWDAERTFDNEQELEIFKTVLDLGVLPTNL